MSNFEMSGKKKAFSNVNCWEGIKIHPLEGDDGKCSTINYIITLIITKSSRENFEKRLSEKFCHIGKIRYELVWLPFGRNPNTNDA